MRTKWCDKKKNTSINCTQSCYSHYNVRNENTSESQRDLKKKTKRESSTSWVPSYWNNTCLLTHQEFSTGQSCLFELLWKSHEFLLRKKLSDMVHINGPSVICGCELERQHVTYMSVCQVEQVPQPTASAVPALVADAVFQHDVVGSNWTENFMNLFSRLTGIDLIYLQGTKRESEIE